MNRQPAVAGYFYSGEKHRLELELGKLVPVKKEKVRATAVVVPHAGYMYSGAVAGEVYASLELPQTYLMLCPNHTGAGSDFDVWAEGEWLTPLGSVSVDAELTAKLMHLFPRATRDGRAHLREHSLEVQLPFLQLLKGDISIVAVCIRQHHYAYLEELGHAIAQVIRDSGNEILIVASSDMTHYEKQERARHKDQLAIEQMEKLSPRGLFDTVHNEDISMCGYLPVTAALIAALDLGATKGKLLKYATSGDITRDYSSVVGYAGIIIT